MFTEMQHQPAHQRSSLYSFSEFFSLCLFFKLAYVG